VSLISPGWGASLVFLGASFSRGEQSQSLSGIDNLYLSSGCMADPVQCDEVGNITGSLFPGSSPPSCISGCGEIVQSLGASRHYAIGSGCSDGRIAGAIAVESSPPPRLEVGPRPRRADAKRQLQPSKTPSKPKLREHYFCSGRVVVSV
jgi:hypothetical protein